MILFYYRELRRQVERLEATYLPKPTVLVYLEALDENGEPWNIVGPNYYWFRDENNPNDKPPPIPDPRWRTSRSISLGRLRRLGPPRTGHAADSSSRP